MSAALGVIAGVLVGFALARVPSGELPAPSEWPRRISYWWRARQCAHGRHDDVDTSAWIDDSGRRRLQVWCRSCEQTISDDVLNDAGDVIATFTRAGRLVDV